ncbi:MAG: hypothetical protein E6Q97_23515 [Desulfurellales bacterium]|nr:MAG: hypothetical protein E6Q97_23515 [Desulfurellales bacterium]
MSAAVDPVAGPYELTLDEVTGHWYLNDARDSAWSADLGPCSRDDAEHYRREANLAELNGDTHERA